MSWRLIGDVVLEAFVVNDSGWSAKGSFTVQVGNLNLNGTIYSHPATAKK